MPVTQIGRLDVIRIDKSVDIHPAVQDSQNYHSLQHRIVRIGNPVKDQVLAGNQTPDVAAIESRTIGKFGKQPTAFAQKFRQLQRLARAFLGYVVGDTFDVGVGLSPENKPYLRFNRSNTSSIGISPPDASPFASSASSQSSYARLSISAASVF
jgi:hypothetical protein